MTASNRTILGIALSLPLLFTAVVALSLIVPRLFADPPRQDFIYTTGVGSYQRYNVSIIDGRVSIVDRNCPNACSPTAEPPRLFLYEVAAKHSREISLDEARALRVDPSERSPDGYRVERGNNSDGGLFLLYGGLRYDQRTYLVGPGGRFEVNLARSDVFFGDYYSYGFRNSSFLGWVITEKK